MRHHPVSGTRSGLTNGIIAVAANRGAALGAAVIAAGFGFRAPSVVGAGLAALGLLIAWITQIRAKKVGLLVGREALEAREQARTH